ncbi:AfsR/SARP family transcriptional regulator [Streptomyces chrestomyceticus]|uniref:AfsR/SARP family transcriptional regulator n=1 Tax=Streptomyces chrestomyceticus TaxID=68185 RepID=UPI0035A84E65
MWRGPTLLDTGEGLLCRSTAAQLEERLMTIREDLITAKLHTGGERGVIADLQELVMAHPGQERFSEQLMIALYRCGRQSEALDVYRRTRAWLVDELGLDVGRSLHELYQSVLAQGPALDARDSRVLQEARDSSPSRSSPRRAAYRSRRSPASSASSADARSSPSTPGSSSREGTSRRRPARSLPTSSWP